jgi:putative intracellular protease/amidase
MKKILLLMMIIIILPSFKIANPKVLMYIQDNSMDLGFMLTNEVMKMKDILEQSGFDVDVATISGETIKTGSMIVIPDVKLSKVNINKYSGFIMPCMAVNDSIVTPEEKSFVKKIVTEGKPVAAQTGAVLILAKAGVLNGKKYAFREIDTSDPDRPGEFKTGIYNGVGVVQDGNIITSGTCPMMAKQTGKPDGTAEMTSRLIQAIKTKNND